MKVITLEIILVRHGETTANHLKLIQGWTDNPLNDLGKQQAKDAGLFLKNINYTPDYAYSSPLVRASLTGEIIGKYIDGVSDIRLDFHFIERNFGPFEQTVAKVAFKKLLTKGFKKPGYEDDELLLRRVEAGLINLYDKHPEKKIIIFCHSHVIKSCLILTDPNKYDYSGFIGNGSLHKFKYDGKQLKLLEFSMNM